MLNSTLIAVVLCFSQITFGSETIYFSGEEVMYSADGSQVFETKPKLLKRTVVRDSSKILEESVILSQGLPKIVNFELIVRGNSFTVTNSDFTGKGDFWGVPWEWNAWTSEFDIPDGSKLKVVDYLTESSLLATSEYYSPDGSLFVIMRANLKKVSEQTYETLKESILSTGVKKNEN